jgi:hypothetical protein
MVKHSKPNAPDSRILLGIQDGFNRKGLISIEGAKKRSFFVLQEYCQKRAWVGNPSPRMIASSRN